MNYYEKHIGDYIRDTVALTMTEDGAYGRLMDQVYQSERALPLDKKMVYRLARATSTAERKAVDFVLDTFFKETDAGYIQKRIAAEIERYQEKQRKAQASANARWNKAKPDANAYANASGESTEIGGETVCELQKKISTAARKSYPQPSENDANPLKNNNSDDADHMRTHCEGNAHQSPVTSHQSPDLKTKSKALSGVGTVNDGDQPRVAPLPTREDPPLSNDPAIQMSVRLRRLGVNALFTHPAVQDWASREVPPEIIEAAVAKARETKGPTASIVPNYLVNIVEELLNPPTKAAPAAQKRDDWAWKRSNQGIDAKGREMSMFPRGGEQYGDFAARIQAEIDKRKGGSTP